MVEELLAQRDAVLFGTWMREAPDLRSDKACLVQHGTTRQVECLSPEATNCVGWAFASLHPRLFTGVSGCHYYAHSAQLEQGYLGRLHDEVCECREDAIDILDEAIRVAKELEDSAHEEVTGVALDGL